MPLAISNQKMNDYLKEMGEEAGIKDTVILKRNNGGNVIDDLGLNIIYFYPYC